MTERSSQRSARVESGEIATSTLAEIYAQQGLPGRALSIYRRMLARAPEDAEIADRIQRLERRIAETGVESDPEPERSREQRERLPWDPPGDEVPVEAPIAEPAVPGETPSVAPERAGPMDARAFEAWLKGR